MTAEQFAYWLQGFSELNAAPPSPEQWQSVKEHLGTVFHKITPPFQQAAPGLLPLQPYREALLGPMVTKCSAAQAIC